MFPFPTEGLTGQVTGLVTMFTLCFSVTWLRAALSENLGSHTVGSGPAVLRLAWVHPSRISGRIRGRVTEPAFAVNFCCWLFRVIEIPFCTGIQIMHLF